MRAHGGGDPRPRRAEIAAGQAAERARQRGQRRVEGEHPAAVERLRREPRRPARRPRRRPSRAAADARRRGSPRPASPRRRTARGRARACPSSCGGWRRGGPGRAAAATGSRGATAPQARCPTPRPQAARISDTRATCSGEPPCDAHAIARWRSSRPRRSSTPARTAGSACNGLAAERRKACSSCVAVGQPPHEAVLALDATAAFDDDPAAAQATTVSAPGQTPKTASAVSPM